MKIYSSKINDIRLGEFDMGGVLYHARYFHIYEELREKFLNDIGFSYPKLVKEGCHLVIKESSQKFIKPIKYGQELSAKLSVVELKKCSFSFIYEIFSNSLDPKLVHQAYTKHAFVSLGSQSEFKVSMMPNKLFEALRKYNAAGDNSKA